ncbi:TlpA family protein disulfide reductase [Flagellimonas sp.]|uniref:TlpA family protein disulfide reductase n=1 Tax=Flagellimonas sp. TaxID=2058762 RepID=UPI003B5BF87C
MIRLLLGLTLLSVFACSEKSGECPSVFFGGEIVNPTSEYVVLYRNDTYIDSVKLDEGNRFAFNLQGIEEGLYHFDHNPELQYLYLHEGDSILIRLNTMEFDESLVFSGNGSEINNFLIEMFLAYEQEEPLVYSYYGLEPEVFSKKLDSLRLLKLKQLDELTADNQISERGLALAKASIDYNSYIHKEKYPFKHKWKTGEKSVHDLSPSFYDYRNNIDLNSSELTYFRPYFDFMKYHFGNLSYMSCMKSCDNEEAPVSELLHFNKHKLKLVDSLVQETELRDILFRNIAMDYLLKERGATNMECQIFIDKFRSLSSNETHKEEITRLYRGIQNLQPKNDLPDLLVTDMDNNKVSLKALGKQKKTVFYFWSASQKRHFKNIIGHIAKLQKKYPDHNFVGINVRTGFEQWTNIIEENHLDKSNQYHAEDFKEIQTAMIIDNLNKCVIVNDNQIVDGFASVYGSF